ncbi:MAG TPA: PGPGW domain-containing protein [Candidatus Microsaccharimonas sp.]|nr:PGPGW domain-containing protein [Candidatus Microsaccharimonas sp.]
MKSLRHHARRIILEGLGWLLVVVGIAALVLPGPGLLALFAGLALLATQYEWAERRLEPVRKAALKTAADGVKTWPRICLSTLFSLGLIALGVMWGRHPAVPSWWPFANRLWLIGGWGTGATLIGSGLIALAMIIYSYTHFRHPGVQA